MDNGMFSPADYAAMSNNNSWGNGSWFWILALFFLFFGFGGNGWNGQQNMNDAIAAGNGGYVTNAQMNDALKFQSLQDGNKEVISEIGQAKYDTANTLSAIEQRITAQESSILGLGNTIAEKQNTCCQETLRGIDGIKYDSAMNTASINQNTTAQIQKVLDAIQQNKIESLQSKVNELEMKNAMAGTVKYPNGFSYSMPNPFCNCGNNCCGNM